MHYVIKIDSYIVVEYAFNSSIVNIFTFRCNHELDVNNVNWILDVHGITRKRFHLCFTLEYFSIRLNSNIIVDV